MYCIIDVETTGGNKNFSKITEIAIYKYDGTKVIDEFVTLVNPECFIPEFISRLTGITNEMVSSAPRFFEIARRVVEITEDTTFVAHNVAFDYGMVKAEFSALGYEYERPVLCTVKMARAFLPGHRSYSLGNLCDDLGIFINGRHRAGGDALATVEIFKLCIRNNGGILIGNDPYQRFQLNGLNPLFNVELIKSLPMTAGVYYFKNEKDDVIYIGKSRNIKSRVTTHLSSKKGSKSSKMRQAICSVDYELTGSELLALLKEANEIKQQLPIFNRALRKKRTEFGLFSYVDRAGFLRFHIRKNDGNETPITTFSSNEEAEQHLYRWIDEFELCLRMCGLHHASSPCFQYHLKQCKGACAGDEHPESYNLRAIALLKRLEFDYNNLIVIDKGRRAGEYSVVYIENGSFKGYGYFDDGDVMNSPEDFKNCIHQMHDTRDARLIISGYLKNHKPLKIIEF